MVSTMRSQFMIAAVALQLAIARARRFRRRYRFKGFLIDLTLDGDDIFTLGQDTPPFDRQ